VTPAEIKGVREKLRITQAQLGQLLGVHPITISKWERGGHGGPTPTPYQAALLRSFKKAQSRSQDIGPAVIGMLVGAGVGIALYHLLRAAHEEE